MNYQIGALGAERRRQILPAVSLCSTNTCNAMPAKTSSVVWLGCLWRLSLSRLRYWAFIRSVRPALPPIRFLKTGESGCRATRCRWLYLVVWLCISGIMARGWGYFAGGCLSACGGCQCHAGCRRLGGRCQIPTGCRILSALWLHRVAWPSWALDAAARAFHVVLRLNRYPEKSPDGPSGHPIARSQPPRQQRQAAFAQNSRSCRTVGES